MFAFGCMLAISCSHFDRKENASCIPGATCQKNKLVYAAYKNEFRQLYWPVNDSFSICYVRDTIGDIAIGLYFNTYIHTFDTETDPGLSKELLQQIEKDSGVIVLNDIATRLEGNISLFHRLYPMSIFLIDSVKSSRLFININYVSLLREQFDYNLMLKLDSSKKITAQKMVYSKEKIELRNALDSLANW